jgi:hypothetical protein
MVVSNCVTLQSPSLIFYRKFLICYRISFIVILSTLFFSFLFFYSLLFYSVLYSSTLFSTLLLYSLLFSYSLFSSHLYSFPNPNPYPYLFVSLGFLCSLHHLRPQCPTLMRQWSTSMWECCLVCFTNVEGRKRRCEVMVVSICVSHQSPSQIFYRKFLILYRNSFFVNLSSLLFSFLFLSCLLFYTVLYSSLLFSTLLYSSLLLSSLFLYSLLFSCLLYP